MKIIKHLAWAKFFTLFLVLFFGACTNSTNRKGLELLGRYEFFLNPGSGQVIISDYEYSPSTAKTNTPFGPLYNLGIENSIDLQTGILRVIPQNCSTANYNAVSGILTASVQLINMTETGGSICPTGAETYCDETFLAPIELRIYMITTHGICDTTCDADCLDPLCIDTTVPPLTQTFKQSDMTSINHDSGCTSLVDSELNGFLDCMANDPNFTYTNCSGGAPFSQGECPEYTYHPTWDYTEKCDSEDSSPSYALEPSESSGCKFLQFTFTHPDLDATHIPLLGFTADILGFLDDGSNLSAPSVAAVTTPTRSSTQNISVTIDTGDGADSIKITGGVSEVNCTDNDVCDLNAASGTVQATVTLNQNTTNNLYVFQLDTSPYRQSPATFVQIVHDSTAPVVSSTDPLANAVNVSPGTNVLITFNEKADVATINTNTIVLYRGGTPITGAVSLSADKYTATFNPSSNLSGNTTYSLGARGGTLPCTNCVKDLAGNPLSADYTSNFTTANNDTTAPAVYSTNPPDSASDVSTNASIQINFSEAIDEATLTSPSDNILVQDGSTTIAGDLSLSTNGKQATFTPDDSINLFPADEFDPTTEYTVTVNSGSNGIKDLAGNALQSDYIFSFTTGSGSDSTAPEIVATNPVNNATDVSEYISPEITFSEPVDQSTIIAANLFLKEKLTEDIVPASLSLSQDGITATVNPTSALTNALQYVLTIGEQITDLSGNELDSPQTIEFTTAATADTTAPVVETVTPVNEATDVSPYTGIVIAFSEPIDPTTVSTATVELGYYVWFTFYTVPLDVELSGDGLTIYVSQSTPPIGNNRVHYLTVTGGASGIKDMAGNPLAADFASQFTTSSDTTAPFVEEIVPADTETDVALNTNIIVTFSETIDPDTIVDANFYLTEPPSTAHIPATVTLLADGITGKLNPTGNLDTNTTYQVNLTAGITDLSARALTASSTTFTTGTDVVSSGPTVTSTDPADSETGFGRWKNLTINFSEEIDTSTVSSSTIELIRDFDSSKVSSILTVAGDKLSVTVNPISLLESGEDYTLNIKTGIRNLAGFPLQNFTQVEFTTEDTSSDTTPPSVSSTDPTNGATGVPVTKTITVTMSETIDPDTAKNGIFKLEERVRVLFWWVWVDVIADVSIDGARTTITINPTSNLNAGTQYRIIVETDVIDDAGNNLSSQFTSGFST